MPHLKMKYLLAIATCIVCVSLGNSASSTNQSDTRPLFPVVKIAFDEVSNVFGICLWILLAILAKIVFHLSHRLTEKVPENCLLIILGVVVGGLLYITHLENEQSIYILNSDTFFLFLLPPIVLETGYYLPKRAFFDNIGTILLLAVLNKLFNTMCIGVTLWAFGKTILYGGTPFSLLECLLFASFITAVDPIAVLATFVEIRVNDTLYIVVFGESLLNDAVSIVLYRMFENFLEIGQENLVPLDIFLGIVSFFVVTIGGILLGLIFGFMAVFMTRFTERTPVLEPLVVFVYAYIAYIIAEMTGLSGILAITLCGMMMKQYVEYNITKKSMATIEYVLKMASSIMETVIFMFMGLTVVSEQQSWNTGFVIITLLACLLYRAIGVTFFANLANLGRLLELTRIDMLIMSYGGLRGALAFALALILDETVTARKKEFITAAIVVVFFTVFIQGTTLGPLVKLLNVRRKQIEEPTMSATLTNRMMDHVMTCLEGISGVTGTNSFRNKYQKFDHNYMKKWLLRERPEDKLDQRLWQTFRNIDLQTAIKMHETQPNATTTNASNRSSIVLEIVNQPDMKNSISRKASRMSVMIPEGINLDDLVLTTSDGGYSMMEEPSTADNIKDLLQSNMYNARRRATIHARSQEEEDNAEEIINPTLQLIHRASLYPQPMTSTTTNGLPAAIAEESELGSNESLTSTPRHRRRLDDSTTNDLSLSTANVHRF